MLLLRARGGVGLDIVLGELPFEETALFVFPPAIPLRTCSAEDLIVLKAFAARDKDWVDIDGILVRQASDLDWNYIDAQLGPLVELKEEPGTLDTLAEKRRERERS